MTTTDAKTTSGLAMVALWACAAIEQKMGDKFAVILTEFGRAKDGQPLFEFRAEMPGLGQLLDDLAHGRIRVEATEWTARIGALTRGLKRANARAYTATELLRNGGGA